MSLSSNSLIHFTKNKSTLKGILETDFKIKYCIETVDTKSHKYIAAVPMVSFCDIPLSEIKNHIKKYGSYGLGLKKEWAIKNGLNPVLYLESGSNLADHTLDILYDVVLKDTKVKDLDSAALALADIFRYIKNYQGELIRNGNLIDSEYRYSDEREWRFCPEKNVLKDNEYLIDDHDDYKTHKEKYNSKISHLRLKFSPDDISYVIIKNDSEITEFVRYLETTKGKKYTLEQIRRLTTRIFTVEQIMTDL